MSQYELRQYQKEAISKAIDHIKSRKNNAFLVLPTGSGKSIVISNIAKELDSPTLIFQPTKEILEQNYEKYISHGYSASIFSASMKSKEVSSVTFATIQSAINNPTAFLNFRYVIIDECHLVNPKNLEGMYQRFFAKIGNPKILGLTATPYRLNYKYIREYGELHTHTTISMINRIHPFFFKEMIYSISISDLQKQNYLSSLQYSYPDDRFDIGQIPMNGVGSEFEKEALDKYVNSKDRIYYCVNAIKQNFDKRRLFLIFASSKRQAKNIQYFLDREGLQSEMIFGDSYSKERKKMIQDFREEKTKILINVNVLTTGFDCPQLDCIILCRPTLSLALLYQMLGRGLRKAKNKENCLIVDCCNATKILGKIETIELKKESDGFKDAVWTEKGKISGETLSSFCLKKSD